MWQVVARRYNTFLKISKNSIEILVIEFLSNTVKSLQAVRRATLRDPRTGVSEPGICRCSTKEMFLNNSQNSPENICVGVSFKIKFKSGHSQMFFKIVVLKNFANFTVPESSGLQLY